MKTKELANRLSLPVNFLSHWANIYPNAWSFHDGRRTARIPRSTGRFCGRGTIRQWSQFDSRQMLMIRELALLGLTDAAIIEILEAQDTNFMMTRIEYKKRGTCCTVLVDTSDVCAELDLYDHHDLVLRSAV